MKTNTYTKIPFGLKIRQNSELGIRFSFFVFSWWAAHKKEMVKISENDVLLSSVLNSKMKKTDDNLWGRVHMNWW